MQINNLDPYSRLQVSAFDELEKIKVDTFIQTIFAGGENGGQTIITDAQLIDIDIQRGNQKKAAYIVRGTDATNMTGNRALLEKFTKETKSFPLLEEITPITSDLVGKPIFGETLANPLSPQDRQSLLANKAHRQHFNRIAREFEYSAAEAFISAIQTVAGGVYDYRRRGTHNASAGTVWSDSSNAKPLTDLANSGDLIRFDGHATPTDILFSDRDWLEFLNTTQIKDLADQRRIVHFVADMTQVAPGGYESWVEAGAVYQGQVKAGNWKFNMWTYPAKYDTDADVSTDYLADGTTMIWAKQARKDRYFGPKDRLEVDSDFLLKKFNIDLADMQAEGIRNAGIFSSEMFHVDAYGDNNNKVLNIRTQSAPLFVPVDIDTIVKLTT